MLANAKNFIDKVKKPAAFAGAGLGSAELFGYTKQHQALAKNKRWNNSLKDQTGVNLPTHDKHKYAKDEWISGQKVRPTHWIRSVFGGESAADRATKVFNY